MKKTLAKIIVAAFVCGLVAETAYTLYTGTAAVDTAIELAICWLVVLVTAVMATWKAINGTLVRTIVHTVVVEVPRNEPEDPGETEETPESEESEESEHAT